MCGIAGFLDGSPEKGREQMCDQAGRMAAALKHRGPDDEGVWVDVDAGIALGHRRLAVQDVSAAGRQPMHSVCGRYAISSNGEIFNFGSLRQELKRAGHAFRGHSDTEVMLAAISEWGLERAVEQFNGMYAFALWDRPNRLLHLVRDRMGEKPLYYGYAGQVFLFGSELKALRAHPAFNGIIDREALLLYVRYSYIPAPYSIYRGFSKLRPGAILTIAAGSDPQIRSYWSALETAQRAVENPFRGQAGEAADQLQDLLSDAVQLRTIADVPTGVFLSGGVDSSTIVALMRRETGFPLRTFTIGMEDQEWDEAAHARRVARHLETDHSEDYLTESQAFELIGRMPDIFDEPFADSSQLPTFFISEFARRDVTVALSGDGGDELFCGYGRYCKLPPSVPSEPARIAEYRARVSRFSEPSDPMPGTCEPQTIWDDPSCWLRTDDFRNQTMFLDSQQYLPDDLLVKVDRTAMANSLETRMPFLDHRLVEFAWRLPPGLKVRDGQQKWILRQVLYRHVPRELIERPKMGFSVPLGRWLRNGFCDWAEELLCESRLRQEGYFDPAPIRRTWGEHLSGQRDRKHALWLILMFQAWLDHQPSSLGDSK